MHYIKTEVRCYGLHQWDMHLLVNSKHDMEMKSILAPASAVLSSVTPLLSCTGLGFMYCPGINDGSCNRKEIL